MSFAHNEAPPAAARMGRATTGRDPPKLFKTLFVAKFVAMKVANIKEVKDRLSRFVEAASRGEEVVICRQNMPVARLVALESPPENHTRLGWAKGEGAIHDDLQGAFIPEDDWHLLGGNGG